MNLGWYKDSAGDGDSINGLYVVKTDWLSPIDPNWTWTGLNDQNNAVFASLMQPGTTFGAMNPPVFQNIYLDDPPQVLFSLKILPPRCSQGGAPAPCDAVTLSDPAVLNLQIENLFSPTSVVSNSIGFEMLPTGYTLGGAPAGVPLPYTLTGSMNINFVNVMLTPPSGNATALTSANSATLGQITTNGSNVYLKYESAFFTGQVGLGSNVEYLQFPDTIVFGYFTLVADTILYHYDMGYEAFIPGSGADVYLYDFASSHWWYTSNTLFPYLYDFTLNNWLYYFPDTKNPGHYTTNPRYFSNLTTGKIITL